MPEANSAPILSNTISQYPRVAPGATSKPKLLDRLREALRSRHFSPRICLKTDMTSERFRSFWVIAM